jgi:phosphoglycerate dehydrogenase-like enzyme
MKVLAYDPFLSRSAPRSSAWTKVELDELLRAPTSSRCTRR